MIESIKCCHIDISKYLQENYLNNLTSKQINQIKKESILSYNYEFITQPFNNNDEAGVYQGVVR